MVGGGDRLGGGGVGLDEDALAGAHLRRVDHALDVAGGNHGEAARSTRIVERPAGLGDVRDAVFELDEDVVAMVDADPVAGAEVLIDPDTHDSE